MMIYNKIILPDIISIRTIVSLFTAEISKYKISPDMHDFWELAYVRENSFSVIVDDKLYELGTGDIIIYPPLAVHIGAHEQDSVVDIFSFDSDSEALYELAGRIIRASGEDRELIEQIMALGRCGIRSIGNDIDANNIKSCTTEALYKLKKKIELLLVGIYAREAKDNKISAKRGDYGERLIAYLKMNINKQLSLEDMARELSISVSRLKAISGDILGTSPIDYFITLKIEAALRLIDDGRLNFTEISERLGFSSVHYFSKLFKKRIGMSPSEYAKIKSKI